MESRELLCRIKAGDDEAFRTMVLTYGKPVYLRLLERSGNKEVAKEALREEFGDKFSQVFKTITVDNGSEFSTFSLVENWGSAVYFAHPYTSWERPQNERHNGLFRAFVPKGASIESFSPEYILSAADELNGRPRKKLGYRTPEELFERFLDSVYAASGCGSIVYDGSQRLPSCPTL